MQPSGPPRGSMTQSWWYCTTARIEKKPQFLAPTTPSATHARLLVALRYTLVICQDQELASKCDRGYSPEARGALLKIGINKAEWN